MLVNLDLAYIPALIIIAPVWQIKLFVKAPVGILVALNVLTGLSVASYALFVSAPFGRSPYLAAIGATVVVLVWAVIGLVANTIDLSDGEVFILTLLFPPFMFSTAIRVLDEFERTVDVAQASAVEAIGVYHFRLWPMFLAATVRIFCPASTVDACSRFLCGTR